MYLCSHFKVVSYLDIVNMKNDMPEFENYLKKNELHRYCETVTTIGTVFFVIETQLHYIALINSDFILLQIM